MVENKLRIKKLRYPRDSCYMSFPNIPEEILEQLKKKRELDRRVSSVMSPYEKEQFLDITDVVKKEMKDTIEEIKSQVAIAEINSILEKKEEGDFSETDARKVVNEIVSRSYQELTSHGQSCRKRRQNLVYLL